MHRQILALQLLVFVFCLTYCSTLPQSRYRLHQFPQEFAFFGTVNRPHQVLGQVRSRVNFHSFDPHHEEDELCQNYFNQAVKSLVKIAKDKGADAVMDVRSVVFFEDGRQETYPSAECADDGLEGQVLVQGIAIQWRNTSLD